MKGRNQSLDVLRGIAILLVLGRHLDYYPFWHKIGWVGVDLFFVLSGFLISGLLFEEYKRTGALDVRRFIIRRGLKIWPAFYVFLIVTAILFHLAPIGYIPGALFISNYFVTPGVLGHIWSLAVEEHFYLLLPCLLLLLIAKKLLNAIPWMLPAIAGVCLLFRLSAKLPEVGGFVPTHMRIDGLFFGVTLGYFYYFKKEVFRFLAQSRYLAIAMLAVVPVLVMPIENRFIQTFGLPMLSVAFSIIVAWSVSRKSPQTFSPIAAIGRHSYSIYLWHMPIAVALMGNSFLTFWSAVVISIGLGVLAAKLIEFPVLKLRDRWLDPVLPIKVCLNIPNFGIIQHAVVKNDFGQ